MGREHGTGTGGREQVDGNMGREHVDGNMGREHVDRGDVPVFLLRAVPSPKGRRPIKSKRTKSQEG